MGGSADENQRESESEEQQEDVPMLADDELTTDVFNFPHTFFQLTLKRTKSFKHKQHDLVNEQSYTVTLKENARTDPCATLGDVHNQLYLMFHSVLEEMYNVYTSYDLVRIFITHKEMVNTNIVVGPDYLGNINADIIMNQIADVVHSNNFIPTDDGLKINIAAICNVKGLRHKMINNLWKDIIDKHCLMTINNDDELCLPRAIAVAIAQCNYFSDPKNNELKKIYTCMHKSDRVNKKMRITFSLQKHTALNYQKKAGIPLMSPGLLQHISLYEDALQVGITVISAHSRNKRIYKSNNYYDLQIALYHVQEDHESWGHFTVITKINTFLSESYYCDNCDMAFNNCKAHRCKNNNEMIHRSIFL